ncbi:hypothetical protein OROGR_022733 [Orobanche gracilis]
MVLPKISNFHHHRRLLHKSFLWGSSSLNQLQRAFTKIIPSAILVQNKAAIRPVSSSALGASKMVKAIWSMNLVALRVLKWEDVEIGEPNAGEIKVKNKAIGLNFIDVYFRKGVYKASTLPFTPGSNQTIFSYGLISIEKFLLLS